MRPLLAKGIAALRRHGLRLAVVGLGASLVAAVALVASFYIVPLPERLAADPSPVVTWRDGSPAHVFLAPDERWRMQVSPSDVDPAYVDALLRLEDKRFRQHVGVDPVAIGRAAGLNLSRGRVVSGGSTLTMQLVRVLEPRPRTLFSKAVESWRAVQLEWFLSKDEILAGYLTFTPYGRNVEGVEAASWAYFGHGSDALSGAEISTLLAVPQAPTARYPAARNVERLRAGRDRVATFLASEGALPLGAGESLIDSDAALAMTKASAVPSELKPFPREVPSVARWLHQRYPDLPRVVSTLDRNRQRSVERQMWRRHGPLTRQGIDQGVAVVADHKTGEVVALVGSLDPWGKASGDQVPMFARPRSPGSALKPFLYAQSIDMGLALPDHLVQDMPASYRGYAPRNYDGTYDGLVRLDDALSRSLNLPFVFLAKEIGVERFLGQLRMMGVESLVDEPGWYGLSVAVGGVEVTPLE
ncbi:MAG: transglycosylase domain-containing protein, partial [Myxococcota bacterium]